MTNCESYYTNENDEIVESLYKLFYFQRLAYKSDIGNIVDFLLKDKTRLIFEQIIALDNDFMELFDNFNILFEKLLKIPNIKDFHFFTYSKEDSSLDEPSLLFIEVLEIHELIIELMDSKINVNYNTPENISEPIKEYMRSYTNFLLYLAKAEINARNKDEKQEKNNEPNLPVLSTIRPSNYCIPNNKLSNTITKDTLPYNTNIQLLVGGKKDIVTACMITIDENINFPNGYRLNEYDRAVYNAVTSLYVVGNEIITIDMIYRAMTGKTKSNLKAQKHLEEIQKSMDKLRHTNANIDLTNEFNQRNSNKLQEYILNDMLLNWKSIRVKVKDKIVMGYQIHSIPILYEYANIVGQVLTVDINILDIPLDNTDKIITLKNYLIRRVEGIKGKNNLKNNHINLIKIYEILDIYDKDKTKKQIEKAESKVREQIKSILDYWKAEKYIKQYEFKNLNGRKKDTIFIK